MGVCVVVDDEMKLLGIITRTDLSRAQAGDTVKNHDQKLNIVFTSDKTSLAWISLKRFRSIPDLNDANIVERFVHRKTITIR